MKRKWWSSEEYSSWPKVVGDNSNDDMDDVVSTFRLKNHKGQLQKAEKKTGLACKNYV
ncbi:MAG: hypothetical protein AAFN93_03820 [Bacteroidota bacterium]